ncbi:GrpB family protein [Alteromonadaceae bacterium BrNp21-10]|nr:GrpB family protein [Alteromonadaceae bacterium BrNp21-10]
MYIFPPNPQWKIDYAREVERIQWVFSVALSFSHIGSTAIDGLYAKDCIDIMGVTDNLKLIRRYRSQLEAIGYVYKGAYGIEGREYFSKPLRKVHLHLYEKGDANIDKQLKFLRLMQDKPALVHEFNVLKQQFHEQFPDNKAAYQAAKTSFYLRLQSMDE